MGLKRYIWRSTRLGYVVDNVKNIVDEGSIVEGIKRTHKEIIVEDNPLTSWACKEIAYEAHKEGYEQASELYNTKLLKLTDMFLSQMDMVVKERELYEQLLDEYEEEIERLSGIPTKTDAEANYLKELVYNEYELRKLL